MFLKVVEGTGYVKACFADDGCKAFHLYVYVLYAALRFAACGDELYYAPFDACGGVVPDEVARLLGLEAYEVEKVYSEDVVLGELTEEVLFVYGEYGAGTVCGVGALEGGVVAEHGVGLDGIGGWQMFRYAVCAVGRCVGTYDGAVGEYGETVASVAGTVYGFTVGIVLEFECYLVEYRCYVVSAHALEVWQA